MILINALTRSMSLFVRAVEGLPQRYSWCGVAIFELFTPFTDCLSRVRYCHMFSIHYDKFQSVFVVLITKNGSQFSFGQYFTISTIFYWQLSDKHRYQRQEQRL